MTADLRAPREGDVVIPLVRMPAAERETGGVAVDVVGAGEIAERRSRGLEPADPSDLGDIIAGRESPSMAAFEYSPLAGSAPRMLSVSVSLYTPKAVLIANVEEARYDALVGEDGKMLVRARYAVRNNQRSFLAISLPSHATLWSASLAGRPVRPGLTADGGLLLPLQKRGGSEEAPTFAVELVYLQRLAAWSDKGQMRMELPAADLPISRAGLTIYYSPDYAIEPKPGPFRVADDPGPWSAGLRGITVSSSSTPAQEGAASGDRDAKKDLEALMDRYKREVGRTRPGVVPIAMQFPEFGPSTFFAAELTAEAQMPTLDLEYRKRGGR